DQMESEERVRKSINKKLVIIEPEVDISTSKDITDQASYYKKDKLINLSNYNIATPTLSARSYHRKKSHDEYNTPKNNYIEPQIDKIAKYLNIHMNKIEKPKMDGQTTHEVHFEDSFETSKTGKKPFRTKH